MAGAAAYHSPHSGNIWRDARHITNRERRYGAGQKLDELFHDTLKDAEKKILTHSEISRYGTLKTWAKELGLNQPVHPPKQTLNAEKNTDTTQ